MKNSIEPITNISDNRPPPGRLHQVWQNAREITPPTAGSSDLLLYDRIGYDYYTGAGVTTEFVQAWISSLPDATKDISVRINSPGGEVFTGVAIYNALLNWQNSKEGRTITVHIDALAASIASVIAMVGDEIIMAGNAMMMIHRASTITFGNAGAHKAAADALTSVDQIIIDTYQSKTKQSQEDIASWMEAETFMTADEAVSRKFASKKAELKGDHAPTPPPDNASRLQAENRLASARLLQAQNLQSQARAHLASLQN